MVRLQFILSDLLYICPIYKLQKREQKIAITIFFLIPDLSELAFFNCIFFTLQPFVVKFQFTILRQQGSCSLLKIS